MKLKLVVASMSALAIVSCPVLAAHHAKSKHHHKMMKHTVHHEVVTQDYKDMGVMKDEAVCSISQNTMLMTEMNQNVGRSVPNPCMSADWFKRIQVAGGMNIDGGKWGNRNMGYQGENYRRIGLNDVYLNVAADVNEWTKAFVSVSFGTPTTLADNNGLGYGRTVDAGEYSAAYSNNIQSSISNRVEMEQAYITISNFDVSPFFVQLGKSFQDFGRYEIHPVTRSMTQVMSETLNTSAKLGFIIPMGLHGDVYVFDNASGKVGQASPTTNYGVSLGYDQVNDQLGFDLGVGYLYNLYGVNDIAYSVNNFTNNGNYNNRVGGLALYADVNSGPFTVSGRYTTALQRFNILDLPRYAHGTTTSTTGAKPWTAGIKAGYSFNDMFGMGYSRKQNVFVGYEASGEAAGLNLPNSRWSVGYNVDVLKNTNLGIQWDHDIAYSTAKGGTGSNSNLVSLRAAVQFG